MLDPVLYSANRQHHARRHIYRRPAGQDRPDGLSIPHVPGRTDIFVAEQTGTTLTPTIGVLNGDRRGDRRGRPTGTLLLLVAALTHRRFSSASGSRLSSSRLRYASVFAQRAEAAGSSDNDRLLGRRPRLRQDGPHTHAISGQGRQGSPHAMPLRKTARSRERSCPPLQETPKAPVGNRRGFP